MLEYIPMFRSKLLFKLFVILQKTQKQIKNCSSFQILSLKKSAYLSSQIKVWSYSLLQLVVSIRIKREGLFINIKNFNIMKYLQSGLKNKNQIIIDNEESLSEDSSDISEINIVPTIHQVPSSIKKFQMINPIRRITKISKPQHKNKTQQIQILDSNESNSEYEDTRRVAHNCVAPPKQIFKKRLVKVSNKCKMEGKEYSSTECSICLSSLQNKDINEIGRLDCKHSFCFDCIITSSKFSNRCPYCRASFHFVNRNEELVSVEEKDYEDDFDPYDQPCYVCGRNDDFDHLLECQYCQSAFCHTYCDNRLESDIPPDENWYCLSCSNLLNN